MLRKPLLYLSHAGWARRIATGWGVARRVARRFVAGETLDEALNVTQVLNESDIAVTLDYLGESVTDADSTKPVVEMYLNVLQAIDRRGLQSSISVKLTHLGLDIAESLCADNLRTLAQQAHTLNIPLTIDMESTAYTDTTLRMYRTMRDEYGFDNVGTVIQAYLYRSEDDMLALSEEGAHIRLCKGAYLEPPDVALPEKKDVDANFIHLMQQFFRTSEDSYLCIATHDESMIAAAEQFIAANNIPPTRYEFQMLYGVRTERYHELAQQHTMRVYVPFGEAWYPYFMRRLAERPANVWFFVRSFFG